MKKIIFLILLSLIIGYGVINIKQVTFVPFVTKNSTISKFDEKKLVSIPKHFYELKIKYPKITKINSISDLKKNQIILLPWSTENKQLHHIKINNHSFYESKIGTVQIYSFRRSDDNYNDFIKKNVVLTAGGTVVLARGVHYVIQKHKNINFPWKDTAHLFDKSDINIVNFKSPLIKDYKRPESRWLLYGKKEYVKGLVESNIDIVGIAGNHMGDASEEGLIETINILNKNNIRTVGAGINKKEAYKCLIETKKDTTFGFLSFNNVYGSISKATEDKTGIAWLDDDALNAINSCKNSVDQLVTLVNWGIEYVHNPREKEQNLARLMSENGATLIIGDQAHWVQSHEKYDNTHISYGLGNYIFDQHWSENTTEGIIQKFIFFDKKLHYIDTIPIKLKKDGSVHKISKKSPRYHYVMGAYNNENLKNKDFN